MSSKKQEIKQPTMTSSRKPIKTKHLNEKFSPGLYITRQLTEADVILIKEAFDQHDSNKMGVISPNDLKQALFNLNFFASKETVYNLIAQCDEQGIGGLTFDSFIRILGCNPVQTETSNDLKKIFRKYDRQNKGYINAGDLLAVAKSLGQPMTEQESRHLFKCLDIQKKGRIEFEQFSLLMHHPNSLK